VDEEKEKTNKNEQIIILFLSVMNKLHREALRDSLL